jgi:hypothetical protein
MKEYCLGFVFDAGYQSVALIKKDKKPHVSPWRPTCSLSSTSASRSSETLA